MKTCVISFLFFAKLAASFQKCCPIHSVIESEGLATCLDPRNDLGNDLRGQFRRPLVITQADFLSVEIPSDAEKCLDYAAYGSLVMATKTPCHGTVTEGCILKCCPLNQVRNPKRVRFPDKIYVFFLIFLSEQVFYEATESCEPGDFNVNLIKWFVEVTPQNGSNSDAEGPFKLSEADITFVPGHLSNRDCLGKNTK